MHFFKGVSFRGMNNISKTQNGWQITVILVKHFSELVQTTKGFMIKLLYESVTILKALNG